MIESRDSRVAAISDLAPVHRLRKQALEDQRWVRSPQVYNLPMYHYDPATALEELSEDALLPNPVRVRDMILRKRLSPDRSLELNRKFLEYQKFFGEAQKLGKEILKQLTA